MTVSASLTRRSAKRPRDNRTMPDESVSTVELIRAAYDDAFNRGDVDTLMRLFAPDAVWDAALWGMGTFEGADAIRGMIEDWLGAYEERYEVEMAEVWDLGNGVAFSVPIQKGRPVGSTGVVQLRQGVVALYENGMFERITNYPDLDHARAAAERLAEERG
jgi:ketosteroid isomerase-like protein